MRSNADVYADQQHLTADAVVVGAGSSVRPAHTRLPFRGGWSISSSGVRRAAPRVPARETSSCGIGLPPDLELVRWSHARSAELGDELREETGLDKMTTRCAVGWCQGRICGTLLPPVSLAALADFERRRFG
jgi:hypothetical protein